MRRQVALASCLALGSVLGIGCGRADVAPEVAPSEALRPPSQPPPSPPVHVQVLAINDFHGNLAPPSGHDGTVRVGPDRYLPAGGAAYLAAHIHMLAQANPNTVVVSAGDLTGASPLVSNLFHDEPTVLVMNALGLGIEAVGNHDLDRGLPELERLQHGGPSAVVPGLPAAPNASPFPGAKYQYLAANVFGPDGKTVFPPYVVKDFGGVKVAFVGMTLQGTPTVTTRAAIEGLRFANEAATANALLPELRAQGAVTAVLLIHQGGFQKEAGTYDACDGLEGEILPVLDALDPAFRVVATAHTHQAYDCMIHGRVVTSAGSYGRLVTRIDLAIDPTSGALLEAQAKNIPVTRDVPPDEVVDRIVNDYEARARPITDRVVGYVQRAFTRDPKAAHSASCETPLGDLIADAQLAATRATGANLALMNPGGIRTDLVSTSPRGEGGPVRYAAAFETQPFGNHLVTVAITGAELRTLLLRQFGRERPRVLSVSNGFTYRYAYDLATKHVTLDPASMRLDGKPIRPQATYRVTVNSFLAGGGDGFSVLRDAKERMDGAVDVDAFVAWLSKSSSERAPLSPGKLGRVVGDACE